MAADNDFSFVLDDAIFTYAVRRDISSEVSFDETSVT